MRPSLYQVGTPSGFEALAHFCSSTTPGTACSIDLRIREIMATRQSADCLDFPLGRAEGPPLVEVPFVMA